MSLDVPIDPTFTQASGSVGDVVYSHNQFGPYTRSRTTPADPASAFQAALRTHFQTCVTTWRTALTRAEREAWDRYALAVQLTSPIGRRTNVGGLAMFVRSNVPRLQATAGGLPCVTAAPTHYTLPAPPMMSRVVLNVVDQTLHPFFNPFETWATEPGAALLVYASPPQPTTVNFYRGPYRYAGKVLGSAPAPASPATLPLPFPAALGQRVFTRLRVTRGDGHLSPSIRLPADTAPQVAPLPVSAVIDVLGLHIDLTFDDYVYRTIPINPNAFRSWYAHQHYHARTYRCTAKTVNIVLIWNSVVIHADTLDYPLALSLVRGLLTGIPVAPFLDFPLTA